MDLYREAILDHWKHPKHFGLLDAPDISVRSTNPQCGDEMTIQLKVEDGRVIDFGFTGESCAISRAAASLMSEQVIGKSFAEIKAMTESEHLDRLGAPLNPSRQKCGLLSLETLKRAILQYESSQNTHEHD